LKNSKLYEYNQLRPFMRTGDLIEWASPTAVGWIIRKVTRQKVNHSSLLLNLDRFEGLMQRRFILEALESGIVLNLLSERLRKFGGKVYWSRLKPEYNPKRHQIAAWALQRVGTAYDYKSLFANVFGAVSQDAKKFFCSEFYQMALMSVGIKLEGKAARPGEFEKYHIHKNAIQIF